MIDKVTDKTVLESKIFTALNESKKDTREHMTPDQ